MSRIGKKPISLPDGVTATITGPSVKVKGPKGELTFDVPAQITAVYDDGEKVIRVTRADDDRGSRALHGMSRAMVANLVEGVSKGYEKKLHIYGTGYGCDLSGRNLHLNCGFMGRGGKNKPQFVIPVPDGIEVKVEVATSRGDTDPAKLAISGCDKQKVGQFAAVIRKIRPPEPYKGKGIRYDDEVVRRKVGKAIAGASA